MEKMTSSMNKRKKAILYLAVFMVFELLIRVVFQPDPWLLDSSHWYFYQPNRMFLEFLIVAVLFAVIFLYSRPTLSLKKSQLKIFVISSFATIIIFSLLEMDQLKVSFSVGFTTWTMWFITGFLIGIGQELLYRGLLYEVLKARVSIKMIYVLLTLVFVFMPLHSIRLFKYLQMEEYSVVVLLTVIYASASLFFTWLRHETNSVTIPAIVHGFGNAVTWVAVFAII